VRLGEPLRLGPVTLRNRIVGAPMERNHCASDGTMTPEYVTYLEARAAGGAALMFTEAAYVRLDGKGRVRLDADRQIVGIARLVRAVHRQGATLGVELNHGGRTAQSRVHGRRTVAPSPVPCLPAGRRPARGPGPRRYSSPRRVLRRRPRLSDPPVPVAGDQPALR
jgi:2,4-dienoyl-CoA reductase-like NADH-dependent reductase (Old Yellow Enzyme family)